VKKALRVLVYEHVSGGDFAAKPISPSVLSEGFSMLSTLISDFRIAGHNVTTLLDSRIAGFNPPIQANCIVPISSSQQAVKILQKLSGMVDAVYVIAPETDGLLQSHAEFMEQTGVASLNCSARAIDKVADKAKLYNFLKTLGVPTPKTQTFSVHDNATEINKAINDSLNFPLIFKPSTGVSCQGLSVVKNRNQVADAIAKIKKESSSKHLLVQEFITGVAASVSLFSTSSEAVPISLNHQHITIKTPEAYSSYAGGSVPFDNALQARVFEVSKKIVESVPGLRGYIGVDFVLTDNVAIALEINPRLTTSYVGLRKVTNFNLAQAIINVVFKHELPKHIESCGYSYFSKLEMANPQIDALQKTYVMNDIVSPPFPISENDVASAIIVSHGANLREAKSKFSETKKLMLNIVNGGNKK
jgi:predicted ATP-grasp superfamily ATP-dependent carboligase